jgi:hypothetical protein
MTGADTLIGSLAGWVLEFGGVLVTAVVVPALGLVLLACSIKRAVDAA